MKIEELDTPVLLVDAAAFERNIARMSARVAETGIAYRPHAKAHKSPNVAQLQIDAGAVGVCCAKLGEAEVLAEAGVPDILITTGVIGRSKVMRLINIAQKSNVAVVADDVDNIADLAAGAQTAGLKLDVLVEVDVGQGRCGVPPGPRAAELARLIADHPWLTFKGLQGYQGSVQMLASLAERRAAVQDALALLNQSADLVREAGIQVDVLTGGGTGTFCQQSLRDDDTTGKERQIDQQVPEEDRGQQSIRIGEEFDNAQLTGPATAFELLKFVR